MPWIASSRLFPVAALLLGVSLSMGACTAGSAPGPRKPGCGKMIFYTTRKTTVYQHEGGGKKRWRLPPTSRKV